MRAIELTIRDQNDVPFYPDSAFTSIKDINRDETDPTKMKKFLNEIDLNLDRKTLIDNVISDYEHRFMGDLKRLLMKLAM